MTNGSTDKTENKETGFAGYRGPSSDDKAVIGVGTTIKGDLTGTQDILIQGTVEGSVCLRDNTVTIGSGATVRADVEGRIIHVEGTVEGDLIGTEKVVVHATGNIRGNITAPRLSLEDGAKLKGAIDTDPEGAEKRLTTSVEKVQNSTKKNGASIPLSGNSSKVNGEAAKTS